MRTLLTILNYLTRSFPYHLSPLKVSPAFTAAAHKAIPSTPKQRIAAMRRERSERVFGVRQFFVAMTSGHRTLYGSKVS